MGGKRFHYLAQNNSEFKMIPNFVDLVLQITKHLAHHWVLIAVR